ncbi:cytochrome P450 [Sorangium sp. So ce426]|uniref:cytochrome P450 n=1 Tax=unclassified Sorangium TaxID=2621164 RepID=UPI003F5B5FBB
MSYKNASVSAAPTSFDRFWEHYLREHRSGLNRALHLTGTAAALLIAGTALVRRKPRLLALVPLAGYAPAWLGHFLVDRNLPATFHNPLWSLRADLRMVRLAASGRLGDEVQRCDALPPPAVHATHQIPRDPLPDSTLAMLMDPYRFIMRRCRLFGSDLFETRFLLQRTICMTGPEAARLLYDPSRFMRQGASPRRIQATLFGRGGVQGLDGEAHHHRKRMFMSMMTPAAIQRLVDIAADLWRARLRRAATSEEVVLYEQAQEILTRAVCAWAGVPLEEDEVHRRTRQLTALFDGAGAVGPRHWRSRLARKATDAWIARIVERIRAGRLRVPEGSPVHLVATYRDLDGNLLSPKVAAVEILNVLRPTVAVSVYITCVAHALHHHPESRQHIAAGDEAYVDRFVQEVRRLYPFFPPVAARTRHAFEWQGYHFPAGARVFLDLYGTNHDPRTWDSPDRFLPDRFISEQPDPWNFIPQGGGDHHVNHRCPGEWIALELMKSTARLLTRELRYDVPPQDLEIDYARLPALPKSHFVMRNIRRLTEAPGRVASPETGNGASKRG